MEPATKSRKQADEPSRTAEEPDPDEHRKPKLRTSGGETENEEATDGD